MLMVQGKVQNSVRCAVCHSTIMISYSHYVLIRLYLYRLQLSFPLFDYLFRVCTDSFTVFSCMYYIDGVYETVISCA